MSLAKNIAIILIIILFLALGIHQQLKINELDKTIASLEQQALKYENDKKQNELDTPLEDRMEKEAGSLGYRDPNAQYYYNDFSG